MATTRLHLILLLVAGLHLINAIGVQPVKGKKGKKGVEKREKGKKGAEERELVELDYLGEDYEEIYDSEEDLVAGRDDGERKGKNNGVCKLKNGKKVMKFKEGMGPPAKDCIQMFCGKVWNEKKKKNVLKWQRKVSDKCKCTPNGGDSGDGTWDYGKTKGPHMWKTLFPDYCSGKSQSPIDIVAADAEATNPGYINFMNYNTTFTAKIVNNGHSVAISKVNPNEGVVPIISEGRLPKDEKFAFLSLHWHWGSSSSIGSEHTMDGKKFPIELHVIHWNLKYKKFEEAVKHKDGLAVLGFFYEISKEDNAYLKPLVDKLSSVQHPSPHRNTGDFSVEELMLEYYGGDDGLTGSSHPTIEANLDQFLPMTDMRKDYYYYSGSLTTPTCNEIVLWTVFKKYLPISEHQIKYFRKLMTGEHAIEDNFRPTQPLNGRKVMMNSGK